MRLSPFHMEIARLVAEGRPNREIKKVIKVSDSRLSVVKANPLFKQQVERYRKEIEDSYKKALDKLGGSAEEVADELLYTAKKTGFDRTKLDACVKVLELVGQASGHDSRDDEEVEGFELLLKATRKARGDFSGRDESEFDIEGAQRELEADLKQIGEKVVDLESAGTAKGA